MVLTDGTVVACACLAAMDAVPDLRIGNVVPGERSFGDLGQRGHARRYETSFGQAARSMRRARPAMRTKIASCTGRRKVESGPSSIEGAPKGRSASVSIRPTSRLRVAREPSAAAPG